MHGQALLDLVKAAIDREVFNLPTLSSDVTELAKKNGIFLLALSCNTDGRCSVQTDVDYPRQMSDLRTLQSYVSKQACELHDYFDKKALPLLFIKTFMKYPHVDHDVDVVAANNGSIRQYRTHLSGFGYKYTWRKSRIREPDKYFYYPNVKCNESRNVRLHLHKAISWNGVTFLRASEALSTCRVKTLAENNVLVPSFEDEILIMAAHAIYENASVQLGDILELALIIRDEEVDWTYIIDKARQYNWTAGLALFVKTSSIVLQQMEAQICIPDSVKKWAERTLRAVGIGKIFSRTKMTYPLRIPYIVCMKVYLNKLALDLRMRRIRELYYEITSFLFFVWFSRFKSDKA